MYICHMVKDLCPYFLPIKLCTLYINASLMYVKVHYYHVQFHYPRNVN